MTSSPDATPPRRRATTLPPALSSMWRLCKLGYRHEPRLMLAAFVLSQLAALPDALLALWLKLLGEGVLEHRPGLRARGGDRPRRVGRRRPGSCARSARACSGASATRSRSRSSRTSRGCRRRSRRSRTTSGPTISIGSSMLRDQVFVLDHMYMSLFSTCGWILRLGVTIALLDVDPSGARAARGLRAADGAHVDVAAGRRARGAGARRAGQPPGAPPVHDGDDGAAGQGSARHRHRRAPRRPSAARRGSAGTRRSRRRAGARRSWHTLAWAVFGAAYVGAVVFVVVGPRRAGRRRAAGARGRLAAVGLHRRDGRRDRVPARLLDGRLAAPGLARGLRRVARPRRPICRCPARCATASASSTCRSRIPARRAWCSTTCR